MYINMCVHSFLSSWWHLCWNCSALEVYGIDGRPQRSSKGDGPLALSQMGIDESYLIRRCVLICPIFIPNGFYTYNILYCYYLCVYTHHNTYNMSIWYWGFCTTSPSVYPQLSLDTAVREEQEAAGTWRPSISLKNAGRILGVSTLHELTFSYFIYVW